MRSSIDAGRTGCPAARAAAAEPRTTNVSTNREANLNTDGAPRTKKRERWLFPGHFHREEVREHLARRRVLRILLRAAYVEVELLGGRVHLARRALLAGHRVIHAQRLPIADALRDHEMHLVVLIERLAVQRRVSEPPAREIHERLWPVVVAAAR